jgi:hypothetical protein
MSGEAQLMLMIAGVHLLGLVCVAVLMLPALRDGESSPPRPSDSGSDDGWGRGPKLPPKVPELPGGGIPLPDAEQSCIRLRGPGRIADLAPKHERRPAREPAPDPVTTP